MPYGSPSAESSSSGGGYGSPAASSSSGGEGPSQTRQLAQAIAKLKKTNPGKSRLFDKYLSSLPQEDLVAAGLRDPGPKKNKSLWQKAIGGAAAVLEPLDRLSQVNLSLIRNARGGNSPAEAFRDAGKAISGHGGGDEDEERINFRTAAGIGRFKGPGANTPLGRLDVGGVVDFAGVTATDPVTYLTGGVGAVAKSGLRTASRELGEEAAERLATKGLRRGLTKAEQETLKNAVTPRVYRALGRRAKGGIGIGIGGRGVTFASGKTVGKAASATRLSDKTEQVTKTVGKESDYYTPEQVAEKVSEKAAKTEENLRNTAMKPIPRAQASLDRLRLQADEAEAKAAEVRAQVNEAMADPGAALPSEIARLERARITLRDTLRHTPKDAVRLDRAERELEAALKAENALTGWNRVKAGASAEGKAARLDRTAAEIDFEMRQIRHASAEEKLELLESSIEAARRSRGNPGTFNQGKRLAQAEVKARVLRNLAKNSEANLASTRAKANAAMKEIPGKVAEAADKKTLALLSKKPLMPAEGLPKMTETVVVRKGLKGGLQRSWAAKALVPRAKVTAAFGAEMSEQVYRRLSRAIGTHATRLDDVVNQISKAVYAAKMTPEELKAVRDALDVGGDFAAARAGARPEVQDLLDEFAEIRRAVHEEFSTFGVESRYTADDYLKHRLSKEGRKWVADNQAAARRAGLTDNAVSSSQGLGGSVNQRKIEGSISDINERAPGQFGAPSKLFDENPAALIAESASDVFRATAEKDLLESLGELQLPNGHPAVLASAKGDPIEAAKVATKAKALGYEQIAFDTKKSVSGAAWAPPEIAEELKRARALLVDDDALAALNTVMDKWQHLWKAYATLPIVGGVSFFSRNAQTNVIQNAIAGYADPRLYTRAHKIQRAIGKVGRVNEDLLVSEGGLTRAEARMAVEAKHTGALGSGFGSVDNPRRAARLEYLTKGQRAKESIKIWKPNNILTNRGQIINSAVEDNARLAHFIGAYRKLGNAEDAAASVRKYLFDYNDLTAVEREKLKKFIGFYTFMRKNTVAQIQQLMENPGRMQVAQRGTQALGTGEIGGATPPQYALDSGGRPLSGPLSKFLTGKDGVPVVGGPDIPFGAAAQTIAPLAQLATYVPGLRQVLPEGLRPQEGFSGVAREIANIPSGGGVEAAKLLYERASERDLFTGGKAKTGKMDTFIQLASLFAPLASKGSRMVPAAADALGGGGLKAESRLRLINALLGANVVAITDEVTASQQRGAKIRVEKALKALRDSGVEVPTWTQLKDAGVVPGGRSGGYGS